MPDSVKHVPANNARLKPSSCSACDYLNLLKLLLMSSSQRRRRRQGSSTETIGSGFLADVTLPVHKGEIPAFSLGLSAETVDDDGKPVFGEMGEIVITKPIPNLLLGLWNDKDNSMYREKYFSKYPGIENNLLF
ncbi:Acetoacetyl-CoA synthetase [Araneus ventricosus]|uniref:Acetoacetyl-CoA synthetase n=1 Tax=Araneus ventricosus TaxID=182803 RepID=A0A4Y2NXE3_ARAVE|nr:Acetoacetyl-CoA synthetase [Araneus ventricosus]